MDRLETMDMHQQDHQILHSSPTFHVAPHLVEAPLARMGAPDQVICPLIPGQKGQRMRGR